MDRSKKSPLVFLNAYGKPFVRFTDHGAEGAVRVDNVSLAYRRLCEQLGIEQKGFYSLRHVHRTISDEARDPVACGLIMGHIDDSMAANYIETVSDARLQAVVDKVHNWLFKRIEG